jgi:multiple sugar transport system permease protein
VFILKLRKIEVAIAYAVAALVSLFFIGPIIGLFIMSVKPSALAAIATFVFEPTGRHYLSLFALAAGEGGIVSNKFAVCMLNSIIISLTTTIIILSLSSLASYACSRFRFKGRFALGVYIFMSYSVPAIAYLYPLFYWISTARLYDTFAAAIFVSSTLQLPWTLWMLKSFFDSIPKELEESGMIDGCSRFGAFTRIILPLSAPGLAVVSIFTFIFVWNSFLPLLVVTGVNTKPVTVFLAEYRTQYGVQWGPMAAGSIVNIIPTCILALLIQRYIVTGLTLGAVKG